MSQVPLRVLIVEDSPTVTAAIRAHLSEDASLTWQATETLAEGLAAATADAPDVVLLNLSLPDARGLEGLEAFRERFPAVPVIVVTGAGPEQMKAALLRGAADYLTKEGLGSTALLHAVRQAVVRREVAERFEPIQEGLDKTAAVIEDLDRLEEQKPEAGP